MALSFGEGFFWGTPRAITLNGATIITLDQADVALSVVSGLNAPALIGLRDVGDVALASPTFVRVLLIENASGGNVTIRGSASGVNADDSFAGNSDTIVTAGRACLIGYHVGQRRWLKLLA